MKIFLLIIVSALGASAQTVAPPVPAPHPPAANAPAASTPAPPAPDLPPDTVLASFQGKKLTYGELKTFVSILPAQMQQSALRDRKAFVKQYFLMLYLLDMAEKDKLEEKSPIKEQLAFNRMNVLVNAALNHTMDNISIEPQDQEKFYNENKDRYSQVKVKVIYVSFSSGPQPADAGGKKALTEEEAKAKAEKILAELRAGGDFVKAVKQYSEDQTSVAKEGDFGVIRRNDNIPDAIRTAIFALKQGEISEPVRQPNGFYLFRAESISTRPFAEVRDEIFNEIKQTRFKAWMEQTNRSVDVKFENEAFFNPAPAGNAAPAAGK